MASGPRLNRDLHRGADRPGIWTFLKGALQSCWGWVSAVRIQVFEKIRSRPSGLAAVLQNNEEQNLLHVVIRRSKQQVGDCSSSSISSMCIESCAVAVTRRMESRGAQQLSRLAMIYKLRPGIGVETWAAEDAV